MSNKLELIKEKKRKLTAEQRQIRLKLESTKEARANIRSVLKEIRAEFAVTKKSAQKAVRAIYPIMVHGDAAELGEAIAEVEICNREFESVISRFLACQIELDELSN